MTAATTTRATPRTPWSSHPQGRTQQRPSTTPLGVPARTPGSVGQPLPPLTSKIRSPKQQNDQQSSSPSYFGFVVEPSNNSTDSFAGGHVKTNWSPPSSAVHSVAVPSPKLVSPDSNSEFEAFRRQSESNSFNLSHGNLSHFSMAPSSGELPTLSLLTAQEDLPSPKSHHPNQSRSGSLVQEVDGKHEPEADSSDAPSFFDMPRNESPVNVISPRNHLSYIDDKHPRLSLPQNRVDPPSPPVNAQNHGRADTLPNPLKSDGPVMITAQHLADLLNRTSLQKILLLDLRVAPQFMISRINGALNLCIPTTLLKRPSYNVQKLADTFKKEDEKDKFSHWKDMSYIVLYDASSAQLKDAMSSVNTLKKFTNEGWHGASYVVRGGFSSFSRQFRGMVDHRPSNEDAGSNGRNLSIDSNVAGMPVAGGCPMPNTQTAANPFFGNIRQNMDLIGGVGLMPIKRPAAMADAIMNGLPTWIRKAADETDRGRTVADRFLYIEKTEQARMQKALSGVVHYGSPTAASPQSIQIAGIEKGTKNRYKDMLPYDHSRVRLQNVPSGGCDYINASHIKAGWSNRHYIATQAPVPATFEDFWRVVWEQDARVVVMLTAEAEGGQRKCHPYWLPGDYGPMKLKALSEKRLSLESSPKLSPPKSNSLAVDYLDRPSPSRRRATNPQDAAPLDATVSSSSEVPHAIIRTMTLSHSAYPFQPLREITQLQYSSWPDFGAPAHPSQVLGLIEHCNTLVRSYAGSQGKNPNLPEGQGKRPIVVHCSAGCGRTGTFCTIDSVIDQLKRQRFAASKGSRSRGSQEEMDVDDEEWLQRDDIDLVTKTVEDLRVQRLSMVQTLRQFVLCYETVLEWLVMEMPDRLKKEGVRRSYHG
ncbi:hypothetical protein MMC30_000449 [Trapelia coarctata]|nr:hypothetical protein [Trapelia coarctata]